MPHASPAAEADDLASSDEVKVFVDEGEEGEERRSSSTGDDDPTEEMNELKQTLIDEEERPRAATSSDGGGGGRSPAVTRGARCVAAEAEDGPEETAGAALVLPGDLLLGRGLACEKGPPGACRRPARPRRAGRAPSPTRPSPPPC